MWIHMNLENLNTIIRIWTKDQGEYRCLGTCLLSVTRIVPQGDCLLAVQGFMVLVYNLQV